jgi:hypothetical protein
MKVLNNISDLNVSLTDLYNAKDKQIEINLSDKPYTFSLVLKDSQGKVDCKISSFGANLWMRTDKGLKYEQYKTLASLQAAIVKKIKATVDTQGDISFTLSNEVYTF